MTREFAKAFYHSGAWVSCRNEYIKAHSLCERCLRKGTITPAEIVHHLVELTPENINDPTITLNPDNLEAVCRQCHFDYHHETRGRWNKVNQKKREQKEEANRYKVGPDGRVSAK